MALGEIELNQDLMALIGAIVGGTIPLGAVMFALIRWVDGRNRKDMAVLRDEMKAGDGRLRDEMKATEGRLGDEMKATEGRLRADLKATEDRLRDEMKAGDRRLEKAIVGLGDEMKAGDRRLEDGIREINERLVNVGDRLSKVEGVIEGMFWGARNQPPETPREGVA